MTEVEEMVYIAIESGGCDIEGQFYPFTKGETLVREGHPLLEKVPDYFKPVTQKVHYEHTATSETTTTAKRKGH